MPRRRRRRGALWKAAGANPQRVRVYISSVPAGGLGIDKSVKEVVPVFDSVHFGI